MAERTGERALAARAPSPLISRQTKHVPTRAERFLDHLDKLSGGIEPRFFPLESTKPGLKGLTVIVWDDLPEAGMITGVTYGLSLAEHPEWRLGRPELCISVRSNDLNWPLAMGHLAETQRRHNPFHHGDTINFGERIATESVMTAFLISAPPVLDRADYTGIDVGEELPVNITGLYPIHDGERRFINKHGLETFWNRDWDPHDVHREAVA
ncbi:suppressor of fused domain protein [Agromyces tardus]